MGYRTYEDILNVNLDSPSLTSDFKVATLLTMLQDLTKEVISLRKAFDIHTAQSEVKFNGQIDGIPVGQSVKLSPEPSRSFVQEANLQETFRLAINSLSIENRSNTPDFILANFLCDVLWAAEKLVRAREQWYGKEHKPGKIDPAERLLYHVFRDLNHEGIVNQDTYNEIQKYFTDYSTKG